MKRILEVQKEIGTLSKASTNPFFKSQYLDLNDLLDAVRPILNNHDLVLLQPIKDSKVMSVIMDSETGEPLATSGLPLPSITDPQKLGSCITYYRRYTLKSLLAISEVDDDGNKASAPEPKPKPPLTASIAAEHLASKVPLSDVEKVFSLTPEQKDKYIASLKNS